MELTTGTGACSRLTGAYACDRAIMPDRSRSPVTGACCLRTGAYTFDRAIMPGEAGTKPTTVIGPRSGLMQSMRDLLSVQTGRRGTQGAIALGFAYLPSLHHHPLQRTGEARAEGAAGLMLQRAVGVHLRGHLSSTSMLQRAIGVHLRGTSFLDEHDWPSPAHPVSDRQS